MKTIRKGSAGQAVSELQKLLKEKGYPVSVDGVFGLQTHVSVCQFQKSVNLVADGIVGTATWEALQNKKAISKTESPQTKPLQDAKAIVPPTGKQGIDFAKAAEILNVEEAAIRAVHQVESGGRNGFLPDGRPMILFEGHIFWSQLKKRNINPEEHAKGNEDILFPRWNRTAYKGGAAEYERLNRAILIHREAAQASASWGMFQIMGFNHALCGYRSVSDYVSAMESSANNQFLAFVKFLQSTQLDIPLRNLNWVGFAEKYNGPGYKQNHYDEKLQKAYLQYKNAN